MPSVSPVLIVSSRPDHRRQLTELLKDFQFEFLFAGSESCATAMICEHPVSLILCEENLVDGGFRGILRDVKQSRADVPVVVISESDEWDTYLEGMQLGAFDFVASGLRASEVVSMAGRALRKKVARAASAGSSQNPRQIAMYPLDAP
jgi:DNA-binding NtrC family response regulator